MTLGVSLYIKAPRGVPVGQFTTPSVTAAVRLLKFAQALGGNKKRTTLIHKVVFKGFEDLSPGKQMPGQEGY